MKSTGIVRRIDELGRIVIPKEMRKKLKIKRKIVMNLRQFVEEAIEMLPDNCAGEFFTGEDMAWYSEEDIAYYLRALADSEDD